MTKVISYIGVIGSGKDHQANLRKSLGYTRVDFKDELLNMVSDLAGYDVRADYDWFKEMPVGVLRPADPLEAMAIQRSFRATVDHFPQIMTGRRMLTRFGTEVMRSRDSEYWAKRFLHKTKELLSRGELVVNADCRFINEVVAIKCSWSDAKFIFCDYRSDRYNSALDHSSEKLAQTLLKIGLKDGQEITDAHFQQAADILGEAYGLVAIADRG